MADFEEPEIELSEDDSSVVSETKGGNDDSDIEFDSDSEFNEDEEEVEGEEGEEIEETEAVADYSSGEEEDEEDEDEEDENYLQKLDEHVVKKTIESFHPELKTLNYEEIEALATVVRDKDNNIIDPLHRTLPVLTRYEKARILGERAKQINAGAKPFVEVDATMIDGYLIALQELEQKRMPFIIQRPLPNGGSEYWRVADLEHI